jgi:hypothetical protein
MSKNRIEIVNFNDEEVEVVKQEGDIWISVRRICEILGIDTKTQQDSLKKNKCAIKKRISAIGLYGESHYNFMLHVDYVSIWLHDICETMLPKGRRSLLLICRLELESFLRNHFIDKKQ